VCQNWYLYQQTSPAAIRWEVVQSMPVVGVRGGVGGIGREGCADPGALPFSTHGVLVDFLGLDLLH
jgi:hypothetical protein